MEQLTLEQAAQKHALYKAPVYGEHHAIEGFKAGAEWQKEQYKAIFKDLLPILNEAFSICYTEGQDDVVERANAFLERLQD